VNSLEELVDTLYREFLVGKATPTLEDEMLFVVVMGIWHMDITVYRKTRRIVVEKDPDGWEEERKMLKRHLRSLCIKGWRIC